MDSAVTNIGNITTLVASSSAAVMNTCAQMNTIGAIVVQDPTVIRFASREVSEKANTVINGVTFNFTGLQGGHLRRDPVLTHRCVRATLPT